MKTFWRSLNPNMRYAVYVVAAFVLWMLTGVLSFGGTAPAPEAEKPRQVRIQPIERTPYEHTVTLMGRTQADTLATIAAEVEGIVETLHADNGDHVTAGSPLLQIALGARPARLEEAKARLKEAELMYEADRKLNKEGFRAATQLATRRAELAAAKARLADMEKEIADSTVTSPFTGKVERRHVNRGDFVTVGTPLFEVIGLDKLKLVGHVAQSQRDLLQPGLAATGMLVGGRAVSGTVTFVARHTTGRTKTYMVEVTVDGEAAADLSSGMTVEIKIPTHIHPAHFIPHSALVLSDGGDLGVMTAEAGRAKFYKITPLADAKDGIWVDGLPEKIDLIVTGHTTLVDGVAVTEQQRPGAHGGHRS